ALKLAARLPAASAHRSAPERVSAARRRFLPPRRLASGANTVLRGRFAKDRAPFATESLDDVARAIRPASRRNRAKNGVAATGGLLSRTALLLRQGRVEPRSRSVGTVSSDVQRTETNPGTFARARLRGS